MTREESADALKFGAKYYDSFKEDKQEHADRTLADLEAKRYYDELDEDNLVDDEALEELLDDMLGPVRYEEK